MCFRVSSNLFAKPAAEASEKMYFAADDLLNHCIMLYGCHNPSHWQARFGGDAELIGKFQARFKPHGSARLAIPFPSIFNTHTCSCKVLPPPGTTITISEQKTERRQVHDSRNGTRVRNSPVRAVASPSRTRRLVEAVAKSLSAQLVGYLHVLFCFRVFLDPRFL